MAEKHTRELGSARHRYASRSEDPRFANSDLVLEAKRREVLPPRPKREWLPGLMTALEKAAASEYIRQDEAYDALEEISDKEAALLSDSEMIRILKLFREAAWQRSCITSIKKLTDLTDEEHLATPWIYFAWAEKKFPEDSEKYFDGLEEKTEWYIHECAKSAQWYRTDTGSVIGITGGLDGLEDE